MDCKTKHEGLPNAEIRDFLAKLLGFGYDVEVNYLIGINGWKEHDVSEDVNNYVSGEYFPFIGTDKELEDKSLPARERGLKQSLK